VKGRDFNLLDEPWIRVMRQGGGTEELSLIGAYRKAPRLRSLAGELPTQDAAVLRLLVAVFARCDLSGAYSPIRSPHVALARWKELWDAGSFPMRIIEDYLRFYQNRFDLFDPKRPFYQVPGIGKATLYGAAKLNGELAESNNKTRLFPQRSGGGKARLRYAEAARWLVYVNSFDDTSSKPKGKGLPSPGAGWLGKLGLVTAAGDNLYETLLLNLVLLRDGANEIWGEERPVWERETVKADERSEIAVPDNPCELLTLQSRRLLLEREGGEVTGYALLGGDFFPRENAFAEQMTVWRNAAKKEGDRPEYVPRRHDPSRQLWRDFSSLLAQSEGKRRPGIVNWLARLEGEGWINRSRLRFQTAAVKYGDKDFFIDDVFSDTLSMSAGMLTKLGESWVGLIVDEIATADMLAAQVGYLAQNIAVAQGDRDGANPRKAALEQAYFRLDAPFRQWLERIDPQRDEENKEEICDAWWEEEKTLIRALGRELVEQAGPRAFAGRTVKEKKGEHHYSAPEAYNRFLIHTASRQALKGGRKDE